VVHATDVMVNRGEIDR